MFVIYLRRSEKLKVCLLLYQKKKKKKRKKVCLLQVNSYGKNVLNSFEFTTATYKAMLMGVIIGYFRSIINAYSLLSHNCGFY